VYPGGNNGLLLPWTPPQSIAFFEGVKVVIS